MLELVHSVKKSVQSKNKKSDHEGKISLIEMIQKDPELRDFFKLVYEEDMREKAAGLLKDKMASSKQ